MRAVQVTRHGSPLDVVEVREIPVPEVGPGEVLVTVAAASVNFGDIARTRGGVASAQQEPPFTLGMDMCGVVESAGEGAEQWVGRRVVAMAKMSFGGMAEHAIGTATGVFDAPPELDDAEAAGFLLPFHTAYLALHRRARLATGERLLVVGGASGVGSAAISLGVATGAEVIALAGGPDKAAHCRTLGAAHTLDYGDDLFGSVMDLTGGRGADVVVDLVGGATTDAVWPCVAREGRYLPVGFNGDPESGLTGKPLRRVAMGNFSVLGVMLAYGPDDGPMRRFGINPHPPSVGVEVHHDLLALIAAGSIRPSIGRRVSMEDVAATLDDHEQRRTVGRSVVDCRIS